MYSKKEIWIVCPESGVCFFCLSVSLYVCLSLVIFTMCFHIWTFRYRDFIFQMSRRSQTLTCTLKIVFLDFGAALDIVHVVHKYILSTCSGLYSEFHVITCILLVVDHNFLEYANFDVFNQNVLCILILCFKNRKRKRWFNITFSYISMKLPSCIKQVTNILFQACSFRLGPFQVNNRYIVQSWKTGITNECLLKNLCMD